MRNEEKELKNEASLTNLNSKPFHLKLNKLWLCFVSQPLPLQYKAHKGSEFVYSDYYHIPSAWKVPST